MFCCFIFRYFVCLASYEMLCRTVRRRACMRIDEMWRDPAGEEASPRREGQGWEHLLSGGPGEAFLTEVLLTDFVEA